jgi:hypothetical protein
MSDVRDLRITLAFDMTRFLSAIEKTIRALDELARAFDLVFHSRPRSTPGEWAYRFATWLGFAPLEVLAWLETCPGAFADEFGEGWQP